MAFVACFAHSNVVSIDAVMASQAQAIQAIQALQLPSSSEQEVTADFFHSVEKELKTCAKHAALHVHSNIVSYQNAADRKRGLEKTNNDPSYMLETCEEAVRKPKIGSSINYWLCYSYSSPNFETSSMYRDMAERGDSESDIADAKVNYNAGGGIWHAVLVKYHARMVSW